MKVTNVASACVIIEHRGIRVLRRLLTRKAHWNAAEIGSHLTYWREPNLYERAPYYALSYLHI